MNFKAYQFLAYISLAEYWYNCGARPAGGDKRRRDSLLTNGPPSLYLKHWHVASFSHWCKASAMEMTLVRFY